MAHKSGRPKKSIIEKLGQKKLDHRPTERGSKRGTGGVSPARGSRRRGGKTRGEKKNRSPERWGGNGRLKKTVKRQGRKQNLNLIDNELHKDAELERKKKTQKVLTSVGKSIVKFFQVPRTESQCSEA